MRTATRPAVRTCKRNNVFPPQPLDLIERLSAAMSSIFSHPAEIHSDGRISSPTGSPDPNDIALALVARKQRWKSRHIHSTNEPTRSVYRNYLERKIAAPMRYIDLLNITPHSR
jgi:hypothetical protein